METVYKVKTRRIPLSSQKESIKLWCFGDIHRFTRSCDDDRWKWFLKCAKEAHDKGRAVCYTGSMEVCELIAEKMGEKGLTVSVE